VYTTRWCCSTLLCHSFGWSSYLQMHLGDQSRSTLAKDRNPILAVIIISLYLIYPNLYSIIFTAWTTFISSASNSINVQWSLMHMFLLSCILSNSQQFYSSWLELWQALSWQLCILAHHAENLLNKPSNVAYTWPLHKRKVTTEMSSKTHYCCEKTLAFSKIGVLTLKLHYIQVNPSART
jgi:hypothetical protein